jgi:hypothetical protein
MKLLYNFLLPYYCTGGTMWHLQKFLQYSWIHPSIILLYPPSPHSWNSFNRSHFSIFIHEYITFPLCVSKDFCFKYRFHTTSWAASCVIISINIVIKLLRLRGL